MLEIRKVLKEDSDILLEWRNNPLVYKYALNPKPIQRKDHVAWFDKMLNSSKTFFYMGLLDGNRCGTVRYDLLENTSEAEVSISISPDFWGKGIAFELMNLTEIALKKESSVNVIHATVLSDNRASVKLFNKSNFREYSVRYKKEI